MGARGKGGRADLGDCLLEPVKERDIGNCRRQKRGEENQGDS